MDKLVKLKNFYLECVRVFKITKKPDATEFKRIVKASAIGMAIIGSIGFLLAMIKISFF